MTKTTFQAAILAVAVAVGGVSFTSAALAAGPTNSPAAGATLRDAQAAMKAKKWDEAITHLKEVNNLAGHTPADTYIANQMLSFILVSQNKYGEAASVLEAQLGTRMADPVDRNAGEHCEHDREDTKDCDDGGIA